MRKVIATGIAGFLLGVAVWADTFRPDGTLLPIRFEQMVPFPLAFVSLAAVLYAINDRQWGRIPWSRLRPVLATLPIAVSTLMAVLFLLTVVNVGFFMVGAAGDPLAFARGAAGNLAWISASAAAMAYGVLRSRRRLIR